MTHTLLDKVPIRDGEFSRIPEATHFLLKRGCLYQYKVDRVESYKMRKLPENAHVIKIDGFERHEETIEYGVLSFYNQRGNILKTYTTYNGDGF